MENEIIDLTNSPPSSPKENPRPTSTQTIQQMRPKLTIRKLLTFCVRSAPEELVRQNLDEGQLVNVNQTENPKIQSNTGGKATGSSNHRRRTGGASDERAGTVSRPAKYWTYRENQRFLMGIIKYGKASFEKICDEYVPTKTPAQVAKHADQIFSNTCWYTYNVDPSPRPSPPPPIIANNNPAISADIDMTTKTPAILQLEASAVPKPSPAVPSKDLQTLEAPPLESLRLFPVEVPFFPVTVEERIARRRTRPTTQPVNLRAMALEPEPISLCLALPNFIINVPDDDEDGEGWV